MNLQRWWHRLGSKAAHGAVLTEYVVLIAALAAIIIGSLSVLGDQLAEMYASILP